MTEAEWLASTDLKWMLESLEDRASDRKLRLFACAYSRIWHLVSDQSTRNAVEVAERYADALAPREELEAAEDALPSDPKWAKAAAMERAWDAAYWITLAIPNDVDWNAEGMIQTDLLRDIFGNPFHSIFASPSWLAWNDGAVRKMAQLIYDERAFDRMPLLADALEDAGCDNREILDHCRSGGEHVRGRWVVDLLLGKS